MQVKSKKTINTYKQGFSYRMVKFKYFIMVIVALLLEVLAVTIFLLNSESIIAFELFNASILFGITSAVIVVLAIGILVLLRVDKTRDRNKIKLLIGFKRNYQKIKSNYLSDISRFTRAFNSENENIEAKINCAIVLEDQYNGFLEEFSSLKVPGFLNDLYNYESKHLRYEKQIYEGYSLLTNVDELKDCSIKSNIYHRNFIEGLDNLEKSLKLVI
jgi:hypothetical protein